MTDMDRRAFVKVAGAAAIAPAVAGCSGNGGGNGNGNGSGSGGGSGGDVPSAIDDYLSGANEYDGSLADHTGESDVTVDVGAGSNGLAFAPPAIRIDSGTTVLWEWTGQGSPHNVVDEDGDFESELMSEEGATFEQTFDQTGNVRYYCNPHKATGMKGGIVVE